MNRLAVLFVAFLAIVLISPSPARGQTLDVFDGSWGGNTAIEVSVGKRENARCTSTNRASGNSLRIKLRCASGGSPLLDVTANITLKDGVLSGSWEERVYAQKGSVSGTLSVNTLSGEIRNQNFSALVTVRRNGDGLSVSVTPSDKKGTVNVAMRR